jgi:uncharacterized membrane protein (UPF0127 family)
MAWLLNDGQVIASLELADDRRSKRRGLLGRDTVDGALLLQPARWIHTLGMRFPIDVAYLDSDRVVLATTTMPTWRLGFPRVRAHSVIEARAGAMSKWGVTVGDQLEIHA